METSNLCNTGNIERNLCSNNAQDFNTSIVLVYDREESSSLTSTVNQQMLDEDEDFNDIFSLLGEELLDAYNGKVEEICDPFFRRLTQATVDLDSTVVSPISSTIRIRFDLQGVCENCQSDDGGALFGERRTTAVDQASNRGKGGKGKGGYYHRKKKSKKKSSKKSSYYAQAFENNPNCYCQSNNPEYRGPNSIEVKDSMNRGLSLRTRGIQSDMGDSTLLDDDDQQQQTGVRSGKLSIANIIEVEPLDCTSDEESTFSTAVMVEGDVVSALLTNTMNDGNLAQSAFQYTFNELSFLACDAPSFRSITSVARMDLVFPGMDIVVLNVSGVCYDCILDTPLYAEDLRDRRHLVNSSASTYRLRLSSIETSLGQIHNGAASARADHSCYYCPVNIRRRLQSPTRQEFKQAYEDTLISMLLLDDHSNQTCSSNPNFRSTASDRIVQVQNIAEIKFHECSSNIQYFTSYVWVAFDQDLDMIGQDEVTVIEDAFVTTYNDLNLRYCDVPFFRRALNASVMELPVQKPLQSTPSDLNFQRILQFETVTECRDCLTNNSSRETTQPSLFHILESSCTSSGQRDLLLPIGVQEEHDGTNTGLSQLQSTKMLSQKMMNASSEVCFCQKTNYGLGRSPTTEEFQQTFGSRIRSLQDSLQLTSSVGLVTDIREQQDYECSVEVSHFVSTVWVEFDGRYSTLDGPGRRAIANRFVHTYNDLSYRSCDIPMFRTILNVSMEEVISDNDLRVRRRRRRMGSLPGYFQYERVIKFTVHVECRNCPSNSTLFHYETDEVGEEKKNFTDFRNRCRRTSSSRNNCRF